MARMKMVYILILCSSMCGCAEMIPTPKDQAVQIDFGNFYMESLSNKYKAKSTAEKEPQFAARLARYDELAVIDLDVDSRKDDQERKFQIEKDIRNLGADLGKINGEISVNLALKNIRLEKVKILQAQLAAVPKPSDAKVQSIREEVEAHSTDIAPLYAFMNSLETQKSYLAAELEAKKREQTLLIDKKYDTSERTRRQIRDEIIRDFLAIADHNYLYFKSDLLAGRVRTDTIADISELLISTATTLTGGVMSKTNLGAASTLIKGARSTVDKNFFAQQTMRAIINAMEQGRATDRTVIVAKMEKPTTQYPLSEAISDVQRYQSRASLFLAIMDLANQSGVSSEKAEKALQDAVTKSNDPIKAGETPKPADQTKPAVK